MADANWELQHARSCLAAARKAPDAEVRELEQLDAIDHLIEAIHDILRRVDDPAAQARNGS